MVSALLPVLLAAPMAPEAPIAWIHDDWARAAADARQNQRPVFVDVWASWCHTCLSMQRFVLPDPRLTAERGAYTWLALDFDKEDNAAFFASYPVNAVPTFFIMDPSGAVRARKIGAGSVEDMLAFLEGGHRPDAIDAAERLLARGDYAGAAAAFAPLALDLTKKPPPYRERVWAGLIEGLWRSDPAACARAGTKGVAALPPTGGSIEAIGILIGCVTAVPPAEQARLAARIRAVVRPWAMQENLSLSLDDRSTLLGILGEAARLQGDRAEQTQILDERRALLERAARAAPTPAARAIYDDHRVQVYLRLGEHALALRMLQASEVAEPANFNHPWRQAKVYLATGDLRRALAAADRALRRGYGGRKIRLYSTKLDVLIARQAWDAARETVAAARAELKRWPLQQVKDSWLGEFEARAAQVDAHSVR